VHQLPQYLVTQFLLAELGRTALHVVDEHGLLAVPHTFVDQLAIERGILNRLVSCRRIGNPVPARKGLHVKYLLEVGEDRDQIMAVGVPRRIGRPEVQDAGAGVDVRVVHPGGEFDDGPRVDVVVLGRQPQLELEDAVGVRTPADEDDSVKMTEVREGREQINPTRCVVLEMFVFDRYLVIAQRLFALGLGRDGRKEGSPRRAAYGAGRCRSSSA